MMLVHKILDCVQVAISTGQREWGVTSLVDCSCTCMSVLSDATISPRTCISHANLLVGAVSWH